MYEWCLTKGAVTQKGIWTCLGLLIQGCSVRSKPSTAPLMIFSVVIRADFWQTSFPETFRWSRRGQRVLDRAVSGIASIANGSKRFYSNSIVPPLTNGLLCLCMFLGVGLIIVQTTEPKLNVLETMKIWPWKPQKFSQATQPFSP